MKVYCGDFSCPHIESDTGYCKMAVCGNPEKHRITVWATNTDIFKPKNTNTGTLIPNNNVTISYRWADDIQEIAHQLKRIADLLEERK